MTPPTPLDAARIQAQQADRLRTRLADVIRRRDAAVIAAYVDGHTPQTIARTTGLSRSQVRNITADVARATVEDDQ